MCLYPMRVTVHSNGDYPKRVTVPCGNCVECWAHYSKEWSLRIMHEASQYENNCFVTLTYNDLNLPADGGLVKKHLQDFIKRLRDRVKPLRVRYYACGEYGEKRSRPHYHIILFNFKPSDMMFLKKTKREEDIYISPLIMSLWKFGFSSVGELTSDSAKYCTKYMQKAFTGVYRLTSPLNPFDKLQKPFSICSTHPGIGYNFVYRSNLRFGVFYDKGKPYNIPRYYLKVMERDGVYLDDYKLCRNTDMLTKLSVRDLKADRDKVYHLLHDKFVKKS